VSRTSLVAAGSLAALGLLAAATYQLTRDPSPDRPLVVYCAASTRLPMEAAARDYPAAGGRRVELRCGASEDLLTKAGTTAPGDPADIFLPADESYVRLARDRGLVAGSVPVATMRAVVLTGRGNPTGLAAWADLLRDGTRVAVANPAAAVGKLARDHLAATGRWDALRPHVIDAGTVTEAANAAKIGSVDAAIVWDPVAAAYPGQTILTLPELAGVTARVEAAVLTQSADPDAARRFVEYLTAPAGGLAHFRAAGFRVVEPAPHTRGAK